jgi:23S rRNA (guanosine2251-2'-O)-methyltransferase
MARRGHRPSTGTANRPKFWGRHPVTAALANPNRTVRKIWGTR